MFGYEFLLWASVAAVFLAFVLLLTLPEAPAVETTSEHTYLKLLKSGVGYVIHQPEVLRLIIFVSITVTVGGVLDEYWPLFATERGCPNTRWAYSWLWSTWCRPHRA